MSGAYDIHFQLQPDTVQGYGRLFSFAYSTAKGVRGFQKTINQWLKCLLTRRGSDVADKNYGTDFPNIFDSNVVSVSDTTERLTLALDDATTQILAFQRTQSSVDLTDDERLANASILGIVPLDASSYTVYVLLRSVLNQDVKIVLPTIH